MFDKLKKLLLEDDGSSNKVSEETQPNESHAPTSSFPSQITNDVYSQTSQKMDSFISTQPSTSQPAYIPQTQSFNIPQPMPVTHINNCDEETKKVLSEYETLMERVNQDGYDFYEYYKNIMGVGEDNISMYPVIFNVAKSVDKTITSDKLKISADFYLNAINESYTKFDSDCNKRLLEIDEEKIQKKESLTERIKVLEEQLKNIHLEMEDNLKSLNNIDNEFMQKIETTNCFKYANQTIKDKMVVSLTKVKNNINF